MIERLLCAVFGHKYIVQRRFSTTSRQIGCTRCHRQWGMNDSVQTLLPWDSDLEEMYKMIGQWPGEQK